MSDLLRDYLENLARIDTPPAAPKARAGLKKVRFTRPFPVVAQGMDRIEAYGRGEVAGLSPHAAQKVIDAVYAVPDEAA